MSLDKDTVARIARLARLKVPDEELRRSRASCREYLPGSSS
jgi:Asp-tRNA(Asn)/Glu-tRNA(Gln) amidotransferase C subunit